MKSPSDSPRSPHTAIRNVADVSRRLAWQWRSQLAALAAAAGIVAATLAGAIGVGDALERGLNTLAVERLGGIEAAVVAEDMFGMPLVDDLRTAAAQAGAVSPGVVIVPAIVMEVSVDAGAARAGSRATLLACDDPAALGFRLPPSPPTDDAALLNEPLAAAIAAGPGDAIVLRLPRRSAVPADSPLGRRTAESRGRRLRVDRVLPQSGLGQFALRPTQATGPLVVTSLATARRILARDDAVNAVFAVRRGASGTLPSATTSTATTAWLRAQLRPRLGDHGLAFETGDDGARLTSRRLILPAEVDRAAEAVLRPLGGRPSLAFLANALVPLDAEGRPAAASVPYSTLLGIETTSLPSGDLVDEAGAALAMPEDDGILIDRWLADDLAAQGWPVSVGDRIEARFFQPETLHGRVEETKAVFRIAGIAAMRGAAVARSLVPEVEGISDAKSIAEWDPPFPFEASRVRTVPPHDEDDRYWKEHGTTPKAFLPLAAARRLAAGRFGATTAWHVPPLDAAAAESAGRELSAALRPELMGLRVAPLRDDALAAARGSTPFGGLFLALSSFVVVAGLLLEWLLFRLLVAARGRDIGVLAALGWPKGRMSRLLLLAGGGAALGGCIAGTLAGPLWSRALLAMLGRAWNMDVAAGSAGVFGGMPSIVSILPGGLAALGVSLAALLLGARRAAGLPPLALLRGTADTGMTGMPRAGRLARLLPPLAVVAALAAAFAGRRADAATAVGLFFAAGFAALVGLLAAARGWLAARSPATPLRSLPQLARRGLAHGQRRGFSIAAIVAVAEFLVVAVSAFAVRPPDDPSARHAPTGGWTLMATFGEPTAVDPADPAARDALGLSTDQADALAGCQIARIRSSVGDDASCTNLYAAVRPTVLGVGPGFIDRGGFTFVDHATTATANPWTLLATSGSTARRPVPVILDEATARWALKLGGVGSRFTLPDEAGRPVELEIVGLLAPGILQGFIIVAERDFEGMFPGRSGYGMALVDDSGVAVAQRASVRGGLAAAWADAGVTLTSTVARLRSLVAVQNTFLAGFQALGTLGLLLGTAGVAAVQVQGVRERQGQFTVLRAIGFTPGRIRGLLALETLVTVGLGLAAGAVAGCLAVAPALAAGGARLPAAWIAGTCGLTLAAALLASLLATSPAAIPERPREPAI